MEYCYTYYGENNLIEYCQHTHKPLMDADPEELKGLIYYGDGDNCPHCHKTIKIVPF